jgi:NAD(P)-dependent dehydrogenase (short-subunit alcohol dehydrogenase family)
VVVITGASSGFGRAAALAFVRAGARVSLGARGRGALEDTARACERAGGEALVVAADVGDADAVDRLATRTVERFGRIDVWVNNAGVILYGRFEDTPAEDFERVVRTNLLGQVHGARAALRQFRAQGHGVLINLGSVWGRVSSPQVPYVASKHAVRAFSECLRQELRNDPGIEVATMLPQAADTPIFRHAGNYTGRQLCPIPPLVTAEEVADGILACARDPKREVTFGRAGRLVATFHMVAPGLYHRLLPRFFERATFATKPRPPSPGNLYKPSEPYAQVDGGWDRRRRLPRRLAAAGAVLALPLAGLFVSRRRPVGNRGGAG